MTSKILVYIGLIPIVVTAINPEAIKLLGDNPWWNMFVAGIIAASAYLAKSPINKDKE